MYGGAPSYIKTHSSIVFSAFSCIAKSPLELPLLRINPHSNDLRANYESLVLLVLLAIKFLLTVIKVLS